MPITGVIRIVFERIPATQPIGALMAGDLSLLSRPVIVADEKGNEVPQTSDISR